ncbi:MAG: hypothetical protein WBM02_08805 [bacterium]
MRKIFLLVLAMVVAFIGSSVYSAGMPLPFFEDFTGIAEGDIPADWSRDDIGWGVAYSDFAGGVSPEIQFRKIQAEGTGVFRLSTPPIDGTTESNIVLTFKHYARLGVSFILSIQTSIDGGVSWQEQWSIAGEGWKGEVVVYLDGVADHEFILSFVFDGDAPRYNFWCIDDICIAETRELDMLNPLGQGSVVPYVGKHNLPFMQEITLRALPSSTWYAVENAPNPNPFKFDPADLGSFSNIGTNDIGLRGGTWAAGKWYVTSKTGLYTINPENGAMTLVGLTGYSFGMGIAYDELNDIMYGCLNASLYIINRSTGVATWIGEITPGHNISDIAYGDGLLYTVDGGGRIFTYDLETQTGALLGQSIYGKGYSLEYDKDHGRLFMTFKQDKLYLAEIDTTDGSATRLFEFDHMQGADGFAIPYHINHQWEFDHWDVDGVFYSDDPTAPLMMDTDYTAQAFFTTPSTVYTLTMLESAGVGTGTVSPSVGTHSYVEKAKAYLLATPDFGFLVDYWEVDGAYYSNNRGIRLVMSADYTAQIFFKKAKILTMLPPGGAGSGTVMPEPASYAYDFGDVVEISAVPQYGSRFDYWEINGLVYSTSRTETIVMDDDYTVQAIFEREEPRSLPFIEDFTDVEVGTIPEGWYRSDTQWKITDGWLAGGKERGELAFLINSSTFRHSFVVLPPIDGTAVSDIFIQFNHTLNYDFQDMLIGVQTSIDDGASWQYQWLEYVDYYISEETRVVDLSPVAGKVFLLAFVVEFWLDYPPSWHIDDILIGEPVELTIAEPIMGSGTTWPPFGVYTHVKDTAFTVVTLGDPGYKFDYWEVDGEWYSGDFIAKLMMDAEHTIQPFYTVDPDQFCSHNCLFAQPIAFNKPEYLHASDLYRPYKFPADDFTDVTEPIYGVEFWGINRDNSNRACNKTSLDFIIRFYEYGPLPGALVHEEIITVTKVTTAAFMYDNFHKNDHIYKYTGMLSTPLTLENGWFSVQAVESGDCVFYWIDAGPIGSDYPSVLNINGNWKYAYPEYNFAFCLLGEPIPDHPLGVRLEMPETAHPEDEFYVTGYLDNPGDPLREVPTFFILEVYGKFWFWPSWVYFDYPEYAEIDFRLIDVPFGTTEIVVVPPFEWPDTGSDIVTGLGFYGAMLNPEMTDIMGEIAYKEWGYGPSR